MVPPQPLEFTRTIMLAGHIDRLPVELRDRFVSDVLAEAGDPLTLEYVRLNIDAVAAG